MAKPTRCIAREQEVARAVAGEHPAGAVGAVRRRAPGRAPAPRPSGSPKPGTPRPQYVLVAERRPLLDGDLLAPRDQARAAPGRRPTSAATASERIHGLHIRLQLDDGETASTLPQPRRSFLLVRHGQTPDDRQGPARAGRPGLHLAEAGQQQAQAAAERIAALEAGRRRLRLAARAGPRDRGARSPRPRGLKVHVDKGLLECDFGEWTGAELKKLMKLPEWSHRAARPVDVPLPRRRELHRDAGRMVTAIDRLRAAHPGGVVVCVSHADPIKAAVAHAMGTHLDLFQRIVISPVLDHRRSPTHAGGPVVLTVNSTGGSLAELRPS